MKIYCVFRQYEVSGQTEQELIGVYLNESNALDSCKFSADRCMEIHDTVDDYVL